MLLAVHIFCLLEENQEEAQRDHPNGAKEIIEFQFDLIIQQDDVS